MWLNPRNDGFACPASTRSAVPAVPGARVKSVFVIDLDCRRKPL